MKTVEDQLLDALVQLDETVRSMGTSQPRPNLLPIFARLDELATQLPKGTDPQLLHYLRNKSYEKARFWLQGRDAENQAGQCGRSQPAR